MPSLDSSQNTNASPKPASAPEEITVFYDGSCPLCRKEIAHYRKLNPLKPINWSDISHQQSVLAQYAIAYDDAMRVLHVLDSQGRVVTGAAAFMCIWQALPGYQHLAKLITCLRVAPLLEWGYQRFARWRYRRRCDDRCQL